MKGTLSDLLYKWHKDEAIPDPQDRPPEEVNITRQANARRRKALEDRERAKGRVQRKRWAHPDDWAAIDRLIAELNKARESST